MWAFTHVDMKQVHRANVANVKYKNLNKSQQKNEINNNKNPVA